MYMDGPLAHAIAEEIDESPKKIVKSNDDKKELDILDRKIQAAQNELGSFLKVHSET